MTEELDLIDGSEPAGSSGGDFADRLLDELVPEDLDWRQVVTTYPVATLAVAAVSGYLLGRSRGALMVSALGAFASETVSRNVNALIGEDVL